MLIKYIKNVYLLSFPYMLIILFYNFIIMLSWWIRFFIIRYLSCFRVFSKLYIINLLWRHLIFKPYLQDWSFLINKEEFFIDEWFFLNFLRLLELLQNSFELFSGLPIMLHITNLHIYKENQNFSTMQFISINYVYR